MYLFKLAKKKPIFLGIVTGLVSVVVMIIVIIVILSRISIYDRWGLSGKITENPYPLLLIFAISPSISALLGFGVAKKWKVMIYIACLLAFGVIIFLTYHWIQAYGIYKKTY